MTLVEQAKAVPQNRRKVKKFSEDEVDLALAWLKQEISGTQLLVVLKGENSQKQQCILHNFLATRLRDAFISGRLKLGEN